MLHSKVLHCGSMSSVFPKIRRGEVDYRYLTSNTSWNQFMLIAYTIETKRANPEKRICPYWKNDITRFFTDLKRVFYSSTHKVSSGCDIVLWYHKKIRPLIFGFYCRYHHTSKFLIPQESMLLSSIFRFTLRIIEFWKQKEIYNIDRSQNFSSC